MKFYGSADLQQNLLIDAVLPLDTYFPVSPVVGQLAFTNSILYICVAVTNSLPVWVPLTQQLTAFTYIQSSPSASWTINHPLNSSNLQVQVFDTNNMLVIPDSATINNPGQITVGFANNFQGSAVLLTGVTEGLPAPTYAYEFYQTTPATTWTINHGLGRYPMVRVFIGFEEVQPASVVFTSLNTVTLTFTTAQVGQAKLI
jgi:hypothetical protein